MNMKVNKVLFVTPYVSLDNKIEFSRNKTGFGYMVIDIARSVSKHIQVDVFASDSRGNTFGLDGVTFIKRSLGLLLLHGFNAIPLKSFWDIVKSYNLDKGTLIRLFYCWLLSGHLKSVIRKGNYDVVHIHDVSFTTALWIKVCIECKIPYVITLHALKSFSDSVRISEAGRKFERDFFERVVKESIPITVLSSGMKYLIESSCNANNCSNIEIIPNAFHLTEPDKKGFDIRAHYQLSENTKIIVCVGNISPRKNQGQLAQAFDLIDERLASNCYVLFIGGIMDKSYDINRIISECKRKEHLIYCGRVEKDLVGYYYKQADGVALLSLSEAFGLSLIEGMAYGIPCMAFTDMEAYKDIYDCRSVVGVSGHSDYDAAKGLAELISRKWDKEEIIDSSSRFTSENMAESYINLYNKLLK